MTKDTLEPTGKSHATPRQHALAHDGYRCMVTGILNLNSVLRCQDLRDEIEACPGLAAATIETAHILNESTTQDIDPEGNDHTAVPNKTDYAASAMAMLQWFGFGKFTEAFCKSGGVHALWNLLSLDHNLHQMFDTLTMWFESTDKPNRYRVCVLRGWDERYIHNNFKRPEPHVDGAPMVVDFTPQHKDFPPPDPHLLTLHAMCARVAHMSGAAEYFDQVERDLEESKVLAFDGSSFTLLGHLLSPFAAVEVRG